MTITENALTDFRIEWAEESSDGTPPSDPSWNRFSDYIDNITAMSPALNQSENNAVTSGHVVDITRGAEETATMTVEYWLQRFPVDGSGNIQDPLAVPFLHDYSTEYDSHTVVSRRETTEGGADGAGLRQYTVAVGARPISATIPGDPGEASPQSAEVEYEAEKIRTYAISQPSSGTTLDVVSTSSNDTAVDVTIEDEGAGTSETITLNGTTAQTTTESFADIDAVRVTSGTPDGDITVSDGGGTDFLTLDGTNTNGIDHDEGVPLLGSGSHASAIGSDPEQFLFLNTKTTFGGSEIADRTHQFDLSAEVSTDTNAQEGTRRPTIDVSTTTVTADADIAEDTGSTNRIREFLRGTTGDIVYTLGGTVAGNGAGDITVSDAQLTDVDDQSYGAGDANNIYGVTFTAQDADDDGSVVTMTNT